MIFKIRINQLNQINQINNKNRRSFGRIIFGGNRKDHYFTKDLWKELLDLVSTFKKWNEWNIFFDGYFVFYIWEMNYEIQFIFHFFLLKRSRSFKTNYWKITPTIIKKKEEESQNDDDVSKSQLLSFPCPPSPNKSFFKSLSHLLMIFSILCLVYLIVFYFVFYSDLSSSSSSSSNHLKNPNEMVRWLKT